MKCPFELPVTAEYSEISDAYIVIDPHDKVIAYNCNKASSDYIVQAINSYEKFKTALEVISVHERLHFKTGIGYDSVVDEYATQALKEKP